MDEKGFGTWAKPMSAAQFHRFSEFIMGHCGIKMPLSKKVMLEARLQKRLRTLGITTFKDYFDHLQRDSNGGELVHMLDAVTTNKTDFFREPSHFHYLIQTILPRFIHEQAHSLGIERPFRVWSAGCSTGEEPFTLAMVLKDFADQHPLFRFSILATDLSTRVLERAKTAIYDEERVSAVPVQMKQKYLLRSKDRNKGVVRIVPDLRAAIQFQRLNLMDEAFSFSEPLDAIFCRNVIIYFDRETQARLLARLCRVLRTGGYLFLGHSESIHGFDLPLKRLVTTVHRKLG
jgi:chemotaxis protein methyltransferase CheR